MPKNHKASRIAKLTLALCILWNMLGMGHGTWNMEHVGQEQSCPVRCM